MIQLYDYFRSSASYRVRIALNLKQLDYETIEVHLIKEGGQQHAPEYQEKNPQALVPSLLIDDALLTQSLAMIELIDEKFPNPALLPTDPWLKAKARQLAYLIACDIHPVNNLRVLQYLQNNFSITDKEKTAWYQHWIILGFEAFEQLLSSLNIQGEFCLGTAPTLADLCLIPQVYNAYRFDCPMDKFPNITAIYQHCLTIPSFQKAAPSS